MHTYGRPNAQSDDGMACSKNSVRWVNFPPVCMPEPARVYACDELVILKKIRYESKSPYEVDVYYFAQKNFGRNLFHDFFLNKYSLQTRKHNGQLINNLTDLQRGIRNKLKQAAEGHLVLSDTAIKSVRHADHQLFAALIAITTGNNISPELSIEQPSQPQSP